MDRIIVLEGGKITEVGTYNELVERGEDFAKFLEEYATKQNEDDEEESEQDEIKGTSCFRITTKDFWKTSFSCEITLKIAYDHFRYIKQNLCNA